MPKEPFRFRFLQPGDQHTIFAEGAFDGTIGKTIPLKLEDEDIGMTAKIVAVNIVNDGKDVEMTFEVDKDHADLITRKLASDHRQIFVEDVDDFNRTKD